jgi:uncharacterized protein (DUF1330 family)
VPKGYVIAELRVTDVGEFRGYRDAVLATIEAYGGRFLVRGGAPKLLEGSDPVGHAVVVVEFDSPERAMEWYNSGEYQRILPIRLRSSEARVTLATGVPPA